MLFAFLCVMISRDEPLLFGQQQLSLWQQRAGSGHGAGLTVGNIPAHQLGQCGQTGSGFYSHWGNPIHLPCHPFHPSWTAMKMMVLIGPDVILQCAHRFEELKLTGGFPLLDNQCNTVTDRGRSSPTDGVSTQLQPAGAVDTGGSRGTGQCFETSCDQLCSSITF